MLQTILNHIYLTNRFFMLFGIGIAICGLGFLFPLLFKACWIFFMILAVIALFDGTFILLSKGKLSCERILQDVLPLGDETKISIDLKSTFPYPLSSKLIDELPHEFQNRKFKVNYDIPKRGGKKIGYAIRPVTRGIYNFGKSNVFVKSILGLVELRHVFDNDKEVHVYPSVVQMKKHELAAIKNVFQFEGQKKMRRLGHSYEFEQIKNYVLGDDYRSINWKATGRRGGLMVNQYGDERSQQIYSVIDRSRVMRLPFNGLSLMDYAVNTTLVISNIALLKHDKAGLVSFDHKLGSVVKADNRTNQLKRIIETLYREKENDLDANYQLLYTACQKVIKQRSLIILYTNFESSYALERVIPLLRRINKLHLLLVVFFKNSEMESYAEQNAENVFSIYTTTMASKFQLDKKMMLKRLHQYGIQTLLTKPEDLSINTVNKYLEFKARGWI